MPEVSNAAQGRKNRGARRPAIGIDKLKGFHLIPGFHAVREALLSGKHRIGEVWITPERHSPRVKEIHAIAGKKGIPLQFKEGSYLDGLLPGIPHQGIVAVAERFTYVDLDRIIESSSDKPGYKLLLAADHITDEGNLGALIRAAVFFAVQGLILPKDRSAGVTEAVRKRSSGAYVHLPVARVVNLGRALDSLSKRGFWIIGAAEEASETLYGFDWKRDLVLVFGSEDKGLSHSVRRRCHEIIRIPARGNLSSLNVAVAGGIILSEIVRQRNSLI
ncbi:MAG: 23S rRNA (guanosine(2251)-2'-O)-methyltransferase RlmB [Pseudomonadota bacterium]